MMCDRIIYLYLAVLGVTFIPVICNGKELNSNEAEARVFTQKTSDKLFKLYDKARDILFANEEDIEDSMHEYLLKASQIVIDITNDAKKFDFKNFKDKELKYAFEEIKKIGQEFLIGGEKFIKIFDTLGEFQLLSKSYVIEKFESEDHDMVNYSPFVMQKISTSNDSKELEYYWNQWRNVSGAPLAEEYLNLVLDGVREAANLSDVSPLDLWLHEYNLTEIENLMTEIQPLYMELHAFIRKLLQKKYGDSIIDSEGLIPHHLFEQVMAQAWKNGSIIESMYPYESLPDVEAVMKKRFKASELYEIADRFYQKLGLTEFPFKVWKEDIVPYMKKISENEDSGDDDDNECVPTIYTYSPKIYLRYCEDLNLMEFLEVYADMGKLYYAKEMTGLPAYFFSTHDLDYAVGKAAILSTSTHHNLKAIGMILDFNITKEVEMNRLLRKSIQSLLKIPVEFVHIKFMADILSGNVEIKDLNSHYWKLMDKYVGVGPPKDHQTAPGILDMPSSFYEAVYENEQSRNFDSEILSYQMYKKWCELSGKYPKEPLHLCDVHGSKLVGDILKKMMRLGTSKPFNEVLATMFPENPTTTSESILEYYSPVKQFLAEKNKELNAKIGWKHPKRE